MLAILPTNRSRLALTVAEYSTFWFYVKSQPSFSTAKLELYDQSQNVVYQTTFELEQGEGIIGILDTFNRDLLRHQRHLVCSV
ncbi:DUF928 domain-containing protein [Microcoleus sp. Aus8_D3]|uniref:DUF928 domain-containing protein n=1 Tax=unclassified Microcoleus TaxID=2642155 RepID=UPI0034DDCA31